MGNLIVIPEIFSAGFTFRGGALSIICMIVLLIWNLFLFTRFFMKDKKTKHAGISGILSIITGALLPFSGDLFTLYVLLLLTCTFVFIECARDRGEDASDRAYVMVSYEVLGAMIMLMGIFLTKHQAGTLDISDIEVAYRYGAITGAPTVLMLAGFVLLVFMSVINALRALSSDFTEDRLKLHGLFYALDCILDLVLTVTAIIGRILDRLPDAVTAAFKNGILRTSDVPKTGKLFGLMRQSSSGGRVSRTIFNSLSFSFLTLAGTFVIILVYTLVA